MARPSVVRKRFKRRQSRAPDMVTTQETPHVPCRARISKRSKPSHKPSVSHRQRPLRTLLPQLLLASININGLTPESEWAVNSMLETRGFDVSYPKSLSIYTPFNFRFYASARLTTA